MSYLGKTMSQVGDGCEREEIEEAHAKREHVASEGEEGSHAHAYARKFGEEEGHVSETELFIAHVLAAMKDCSLLGKEGISSSSARATQTLSEECADVRTSSRAWSSSAARTGQTSSSKAHAAASTSSSSASTSSQVNGDSWTSSQAASQAHVASQTSSKAHMSTRSSSQENAAALCIASLKHTHNKENYVPSNRSVDMQDERAQPKFKNLADLYKLSEP